MMLSLALFPKQMYPSTATSSYTPPERPIALTIIVIIDFSLLSRISLNAVNICVLDVNKWLTILTIPNYTRFLHFDGT